VLEGIGRDGPEDLARYGRSASRLRFADELDALVAAWIAEHDRDEVLAVFRARRVPVGPVHDLAELARDPHVRARESLSTFPDPALGSVTLVAPTPKLGATPGRHAHAGPALSAHTDEVLRDWLALPADEIARLRAAEAI
jgi:formyl-CoA transferase